jgi:hypothetical protein
MSYQSSLLLNMTSYHWLVRFDQQVNTPFHVDIDQSFLMLGYEPSEKVSYT